MAPFAAFVGVMAVERALSVRAAWLYPVRGAITLAVMLVFSRHLIRRAWPPSRALASVAIGVAVFVVWVGPDILWPGYRQHWLFSNSLLGKPASTLPDELRGNTAFLLTRIFGSVALVPVLEELFWRGWLMRWVISPRFEELPLGTYVPLSFWVTAALFGSEHGSYWDVGFVTGIIYNWWMIRTRSLADCILAHAVTNGCLALYVLGWKQWQYWL